MDCQLMMICAKQVSLNFYTYKLFQLNFSLAINVETLLKCDLTTPLKTSIPLSSPTFPIPGSTESNTHNFKNEEPVESPSPRLTSSPPVTDNKPIVQSCTTSVDQPMYYTPDEEEADAADEKFNKTESTSYVPPFNNPLYPNNISYTTYGSVIGKVYYTLF